MNLATPVMPSGSNEMAAPGGDIFTEASNVPVEAPELEAVPSPSPEPIVSPEAKEPSVGAKFSAIAKKERALLERERAFKEKESSYNTYEKLKADIKADPIKYLESIGLSYADITDYIINTPSSPEQSKMKELEAKLDAFKKEREDSDKAQQQKLIEQATTTFKSNITSHIEKNQEKYEALAFDSKDNTELVFQVIQQYWEETGGMEGGKTLDFDTACEYVEKQLEKELEEKAERLSKTKKFGSKFRKTEIPVKKANDFGIITDTGIRTISSAPDTISNRVHTTAMGAAPSKRPLSDEESLEQAAKMIQWVTK